MKIRFLQILSLLLIISPLSAQETSKDLRIEAKKIRMQMKELGNQAMILEAKAKIIESQPKIDACIALMKAVKPKKSRKILVYTRTTGYRHSSITMGAAVFTQLGATTGAFEVTSTDDPAIFTDAKLAEFDGILMLSTTGSPIPDEGRSAFERYLDSGKGLIGIHAATDCHRDWKNYMEAIGGGFDGHPWRKSDLVTLYNEDTSHPCCKNVPQGFQLKDEIYQYRKDDHFTRDKLRILLSLDLSGPGMKKAGMKRKDHDYAVSWIREYSKSRVFYTNLGHNESTFINEVALQHMLAGIQYALGDIEADATASAKLGKKPKAAPAGF